MPLRAGAQEDVGHKTLGTVGLQAGSQPSEGIYLLNRFLRYRATKVVGRTGEELPVGLDLDVFAGSFGVAATLALPKVPLFWNAAVGVPLAHATATTVRPEASVDRFGIGDFFVMPLKFGWRSSAVHVVTSYGLYAPTGRYEPRGGGGIGRGHWTHQLSLGGTVFFDAAQVWSMSALASYDINLKKRGIDFTRGSTVQVQGGVGATLARLVDIGLAGYTLFQVTDDAGADVPDVVRGARDRAFGLGPEVGLAILPIRARVSARYELDVAGAARPLGSIFVLGLTTVAWKPDRR